MSDYPYIFLWWKPGAKRSPWGAEGSPLYNKRFRVLARAGGGKNARLVEFEDGIQHIISGNAVRKAK